LSTGTKSAKTRHRESVPQKTDISNFQFENGKTRLSMQKPTFFLWNPGVLLHHNPNFYRLNTREQLKTTILPSWGVLSCLKVLGHQRNMWQIEEEILFLIQ
jgi:hypothetical protein